MNRELIEILSPIAPTSFQIYKGAASTYITFFEILGTGAFYADNKMLVKRRVYQVDLWSKENYIDMVKDILDALEEGGFIFVEQMDLYESDTGIYHKAITVSKDERKGASGNV